MKAVLTRPFDDGRSNRGVFEPDVLLPEQWRGMRTGWVQPEVRLYLAVLEDAVETLRKYAGSRDERARAESDDILAWVRGARARIPFARVVEACFPGIEPETMAQKIEQAWSHWDPKHRITRMKLAYSADNQYSRRQLGA